MGAGCTGDPPPTTAAEQSIGLDVVRLPEVRRGVVLLPRRWVVERSFARLARCRRLKLVVDRLLTTLARPHFLAFADLLLGKTGRICKIPKQPLDGD